ncbi:uncharacterized protein LOC126983492 [Eriocheir sinensis]|uniref:uncharacterized protein LOC126983492 n=1 Tax=Eriocheir sinensis TaxID=95602 RepID=UPI0021C93DAD|nr:uncharacterized protein LOC126983492 [Eriocheir sinensis]
MSRGWSCSHLSRTYLPLVLMVLTRCGVAAASSDGNETVLTISTCSQPDCLRCDLEEAECVKCLYVMMAASRRCVPACPSGHSTSWPSHGKLMGRVCTERGMLALVSGRDVTIIAGAAVGGAVCVGVVIGTLLYMRRRAKPLPYYPPAPEPRQRYPLPRLWKDKRPNTSEKAVADDERAEFLEQLACLRGEANNFLEMLSHTRTKFRSLGGPDSPADTKAKAYRAVVRDLSRVLTLLNRREEHILTVPGDWRRLLSWAARVLARYKRQKTLKENGELPALDPIYAGGGTLYQTRKQTQAQRCRLVQGAPPPTIAGTHTPTPTPSLKDSVQGNQDSSCSNSQMGSRSDSMVSLTPIIFEEAEDEGGFEGYEDEDEEEERAMSRVSGSEEDPTLCLSARQDRDTDVERQNKPQTASHSVKLNTVDACSPTETIHSQRNQDPKPVSYIPKANHFIPHKPAETNNNNDRNSNYNHHDYTMHHYDHFPSYDKHHYDHYPTYDKPGNTANTTPCSLSHEAQRPYLSIREQILNLRNMEKRDEGRNIDKYVTPEGSPVREHLLTQRGFKAENEATLKPSLRNMENREQGRNTGTYLTPQHPQRSFGVENEATSNTSLRNMEQRGQGRHIDTRKVPPVSQRSFGVENEATSDPSLSVESPRPFLGPTVFERSAVNAALPGDDVYTNVIRKPVVVSPAMFVGDPYRDDTIERKENARRGEREGGGGDRKERRGAEGGVGGGREDEGAINVERGGGGRHISRKPPRSCKVEARHQMSVPRCELTTDL